MNHEKNGIDSDRRHFQRHWIRLALPLDLFKNRQPLWLTKDLKVLKDCKCNKT